MPRINLSLEPSYVCAEVERRPQAFPEAHPEARVAGQTQPSHGAQ